MRRVFFFGGGGGGIRMFGKRRWEWKGLITDLAIGIGVVLLLIIFFKLLLILLWMSGGILIFVFIVWLIWRWLSK
jgi:hypothetical protein